jgi:hypothetical protein
VVLTINRLPIFSEHAALSAFENDSQVASGLRDFNISGLANLTQIEYDALQPIQWPVLSKVSHKAQHDSLLKVSFLPLIV